MRELPLAYRLSLSGTTLIEASAGTGKTYTLVRLMARHLLWHGHGIEQVLAVTFTNAAAAELKTRLRHFLQQVATWLEQATEDDDVQHLFQQRPDGVSVVEFYARLHQALASIDRAAVYTIHGFCQALLQRHALAFGQSIPAPSLLENERALIQQVCVEFWREHSFDAQSAAALNREFRTPEQMANMLPELLSQAELMPPAATSEQAPDGNAALIALQTCYAANHDIAQQEMLEAFKQGALHGNSFKTEAHVHEPFTQLANFLRAPQLIEPPHFSRIAFSQIKEKKNKIKPSNSLLHALDAWNAFADAQAAYQSQRSLNLYHALKAFAQNRMAVLKREQNLISFDDIIGAVHAVLDRGDAELASEIRLSWPVALVDEFQDTDSRQWRIFECLYHQANPHSLMLIGDPKQAIYGFRGGDIHTYMAVQSIAEQRASLDENFRAHQALLDGIQHIFTARHIQPFLNKAIAFTPIRAGRPGAQLFCGADPRPAISLLELSGADDSAPISIELARLQAADGCANAIAELLIHARAGQACVHEAGTVRALDVHDIVVLVNRNKDARLMQSALRLRQIDSVCVRRNSLFESYAALDVLALLHYLQTPNVFRAEQTALHGLLWRAALNNQTETNPTTLMSRLQQSGPLAALSPLLKAAHPQLLLEPDGERLLADYAQVLELLQAQYKTNAEMSHYRDWLAQRIALAANNNEVGAELPYLESSQPRVRIMTVHQSKGLEFGYVFMPFTAVRQQPRKGFARYVQNGQRCLHLKHNMADDDIKALIEQEHRAEALRLLYVGLTRARFAVCCSWGAVKEIEQSALGYLLAEQAKNELPRVSKSLSLPVLSKPAMPRQNPCIASPDARLCHWQISSFSGWHKSFEPAFSQAADDEQQSLPLATDSSPYKGAAFGNAMHMVLEQAQTGPWQKPTPAALAQCSQALLHFGYSASAAEAGAGILADLVYRCLHAKLPEATTLIALGDRHKRHEMEFHLRLCHANSAQVLALLQRYGYCLGRTRLGFAESLNGLLTGKIDLLYRHVGRTYILDYKSNSLSDYSAPALLQSIRDNEYDLQYVLYSVAVHRWLRQQQRDYRYAQHFGGVRYLYARGIDLSMTHSGVFCDLPDADLIQALDACFDGEQSHV